MKKLLAIMAALACSYATTRAETLNSDNLANGFTEVGGTTALTTGRLRIGVFRTLSDAAVTAAANNLEALNDDFVPLLDVAQTFNAGGSDGFFARTDTYNGGSTVYSTAGGTATITYDATPGVDDSGDTNTTDLAGKNVYVWVLNSTSLATATQHGIFKSLDKLPDSDVVPPVEVTVSLEGATALVGSAATGNNIGGTLNSHVLANITGPTLAPEIALFQNTTELTSGGTFNFGTPIGGSVAFTFTVHNIGTGPLTVTSVNTTGTNSSEFVVSGITTPVTVNPVIGANSTAFVVTFTPTGSGNRTATLQIAHNDPDDSEAPFTLTLNGTGDSVAPTAPVIATPTANQVFTLANLADTVNVSGTVSDNINVSAVEVSLNGGPFVNATLGGSQPAAVTFNLAVTPNAGVNTIAVRAKDNAQNFSTTVTRNFIVQRPLAVNIVGSGTVTNTFLPSPKNFQVGKKLTITATPNAGHIFTGWTLGGGATVEQIGVAPSALEKTTLSFTFVAGMTLTANFQPNPFVALAGTYNGLVEETFRNDDISANSTHGFFNATVQNTGAFSGKLTIDGFVLNVNGAFDHTGVARFGTARLTTVTVARTNKPSLKVSLTATLASPFTIAGTVTQTAYKKSDIVATSTVTADRAFYGSQTLTAGIANGSAAVNMASTAGRTPGEQVTGSGIPASTTILSVDSPTQITLSANATATNAAAKLTFTRYVDPAYLGAANADGIFTVIIPSKPAYYSVEGTFDDTLDTFDTIDPHGFSDGDVVVFQETDPNNPALPAGVIEGQEYTVMSATANSFQISLDNGVTAEDITSALGEGTAVLDPANHQIPGFATEDYPQGYGYGTLKITKSGVVSLTGGNLADGTTVTASSTLSEFDQVALFAQLYNKLGFFCVLAGLDDLNPDSDVAAVTDAKWMRPFDSKSHYYPYGWPEVINTGFMAAKYNSAGSVVKRVDGTDPDLIGDELLPPNTAFGNAGLTFSEGQLEADVEKLVSIATNNAVTKVPDPADATFALTLTASSGALSGNFIHTNDTKPTYKGILYQKGSMAGGWGFFLTQKVVVDYTGESGLVELLGSEP